MANISRRPPNCIDEGRSRLGSAMVWPEEHHVHLPDFQDLESLVRGE